MIINTGKSLIGRGLTVSAMVVFAALLLSHLNFALAEQALYSDRPEVRGFAEELSKKHGFNKSELMGLFRRAKKQHKVLESMSKPAERELTWKGYRPIFLNESRIEGGAKFWRQHERLLKSAQQEYGVPPEIIVAIIGVETKYGKYLGKHPVLDSLVTLGFDGKRRQKFFRSELEAFLLLARDESIDPFSIKGSYAGAMGMPQFISSSYRHYAVDFDQDGKRNLWDNPADVIGSVANYFKSHRWTAGATVVVPAKVSGDVTEIAVKRGRKGLKPSHSLASLQKLGVVAEQDNLAGDKLATLIEFEGVNGKEYWLGLPNFYVITRYNQSAMYAMAVHQLSQQIKDQYQQDLNDQQNTYDKNKS